MQEETLSKLLYLTKAEPPEYMASINPLRREFPVNSAAMGTHSPVLLASKRPKEFSIPSHSSTRQQPSDSPIPSATTTPVDVGIKTFYLWILRELLITEYSCM